MPDNFSMPVAFHFSVHLAGDAAATLFQEIVFQEIEGLGQSTPTETESLAEGGPNRFVHRLPDRAKHSNLVLKRGIILSDAPLIAWTRQAIDADVAAAINTKDLTIDLMNAEGSVLASWAATGCWPVKLDIGDLDAMTNEIAIETLEIAYRDVARRDRQVL
ncbi:MAG: phage tail protein [Pseudomonadota bacterium]